MGTFDDSGGAFDWGVYPIGRPIGRARPVASLDILLNPSPVHEPGRVESYMLTAVRYERSPAEIMEIFHRLDQAGQITLWTRERAYEVVLSRLLRPEYDKVIAWLDEAPPLTDPSAKPPEPKPGPPVAARPPLVMPSPRYNFKKGDGPPRLSSDPPSPKIEV